MDLYTNKERAWKRNDISRIIIIIHISSEQKKKRKNKNNMCLQINNLYTCGHRSFKRFDNCSRFGQGCFGAGGSNHKNELQARVCHDCKIREARESESQFQTYTSDGGSPDSNGGGGGGGVLDKKDPWWEGDPWKKYRKE